MDLAPYSVTTDSSKGRRHAEDGAGDGDHFELDRRRILSSAAFRRLQYKTQVFVIDEHDHFRTRLTHTLEVAEIARRLAKALDANETLAESIALAHDLGHAPFGHAGEVQLRELMKDAGGFEHNVQSLRVIDYLEHPYPGFRGLNLTYEVREGLIKHVSTYDHPDVSAGAPAGAKDLLESGPFPTLEAQIACVADRVAYDCHDLEDALGAQLVTEDSLAEVALWQESSSRVREHHAWQNVFAVRRPILDDIADDLIADCVAHSTGLLQSARPNDPDDIRRGKAAVVGFSDHVVQQLSELESFMLNSVYRHHLLVRMDAKARRFIERLFNAFTGNPGMLPSRFANRIDDQGVDRAVCDYISGMTDRFCQDEYKRLFEPYERG